MDAYLQRLADAPIANALALNLPNGRRPPPRAAKPVYEGDVEGGVLTAKEVHQRRVDAENAKHRQLLNYYASTSVPFERIAGHLKMQVDHVATAMKLRGREA